MAQHKPSPFYLDPERPFAQRTDGMSLDIIHPRDVPRGKIPYIKDEDLSLKTADIDRALPHYPHLNYLQKPDFSVGNTDPDHFGGKARTYYAPMDRRPRDLSLTTADIEYAQATNKVKGNRHTDPTCPNYEMPSTHVRPVTPPRWNGRHCHDISDIEKSCSKVRIPTRNYVRDTNDASDIEYASANYQERVHRRTRNGKPDITMNVKDINQTKPLHYAVRCSNPLEPEYKVSTTATTSLHTKYTEELGRGDVRLHPVDDGLHGQVHGSKPRKLQWDNGEPQFSLVREDIAGTVPQRWVGAVPCNIYDPPDVKEVISFHDPHDIPGAQVGSLKKGIEGSRRGGSTNPLNPRYRMLDGDARPQPVPVFDAERNVPTHSLVKSRAQASSLPNLRAGTPSGSVPPSQRGMQRDASDGMLRRGPAVAIRESPMASQRSGMGTPSAGRAYAEMAYRSSPPQNVPTIRMQESPARAPSGRGTPSGYAMPPGYTMPPGPMPDTQDGGPSPGGNAEYYGGDYGAPPGGQYYENYGPPPESYGPQGGMPTGGGQPGYSYGPPGDQQYYGQSSGDGDYGDGYVPEGYVA